MSTNAGKKSTSPQESSPLLTTQKTFASSPPKTSVNAPFTNSRNSSAPLLVLPDSPLVLSQITLKLVSVNQD